MTIAAEPVPPQPYRPANGTEGNVFMAQWCANCARDREHQVDPDNADGCDILAATFVYERDHPKYPPEWRCDGPSGPRCTAFVKAEIAGPEPIDPAAAVGWLL